jgi:hypothetical protein
MSIFSQPVSWIIAAIIVFYLSILLRSLFTFFFRGGRRQLLEHEADLLTKRDTEDNTVPTGLVKDSAQAKKDAEGGVNKALKLLGLM